MRWNRYGGVYMDTTDFIDEINERINSRNNCVENRFCS